MDTDFYFSLKHPESNATTSATEFLSLGDLFGTHNL